MDLELDVVNEINRARTNPTAYAASIRNRLAYFKAKEYFPPDRGGKTAVVTKEGVNAVQDALNFLARQQPLAPLSVENVRMLQLAAEDHLNDLGPQGAIGHEGSDNSSSAERISRYGQWFGKCGENLWFGREGTSARQMIEDLIVDDGVPSRGHRLGIYDVRFNCVGVRIGSHKTFGSCCVMDFAAECTEDPARVKAREARGPPEINARKRVETQWKNLGTCKGCGEAIHGGSVVEGPLGKWHRSCFVCTGCQISLVGVPYRQANGKPFCKPCDPQGAAECGEHKAIGRSTGSAGLRAASAARAGAGNLPQLERGAGQRGGSVTPRQPSSSRGPQKTPRNVSNTPRGGRSLRPEAQQTSMVSAKQQVDALALNYGDF